MIKVTIELQSAISGTTTKLGEMYISNDGTSLVPTSGDYFVSVCRKGKWGRHFGRHPEQPQRIGTVKNYPRLAYNVWRLVSRAILSAFPEEN